MLLMQQGVGHGRGTSLYWGPQHTSVEMMGDNEIEFCNLNFQFKVFLRRNYHGLQ
jgi:hypothetical protein